MKKLILCSALLLSNYAVQAVTVEEYVKSKLDLLNLLLDQRMELSDQLTTAESSKYIELSCKIRKLDNTQIYYLDQLSKDGIMWAKDKEFAKEIAEITENLSRDIKKAIIIQDQEIRKEFKINQNIKTFTLETLCDHAGYK